METCEEEPVESQQPDPGLSHRLQPDCILTIGSQRLAAVLAEETDGSANVIIQGKPAFWVDDTGTLQMPAADIEVRVSNIVRMETDEDELASHVPAFSVKLARLGRTEVKLAPEPATIQEAGQTFLVPPDSRRNLFGQIVIVLVTIAALLVFFGVAWRYHARQADSIGSKNGTVPHDPALTDGRNGGENAEPEPTPEILRLPGVEPFLRPEVARKLDLTPSQKGAIGRLNATTQLALEDLGKYWESPGRLELARRQAVLLDAAHQDALELLTDKQRRQWDAMTRP